MTTGQTVRHDAINRHLPMGVEFLEVFPSGRLFRDLEFTRSIPVEHKSYTQRPVFKGQSPLLIRKSYWDECVANKKVPTHVEET